MTTAPDSRGSKAAVIAAVLLAAHASVVAWVVYGQARAWPHVGAWEYLILYLTCPGLFFHGFRLAFRWRTGRLPARRWLLRVFTIPAGLALAMALSSWASGLAVARFTRAHEPLIARISASLPSPCAAAAASQALPSVAAYIGQADRVLSGARLKYNQRRFVVAWDGGSLDVDGSTLYYDSASKQWRQFHNDNAAGSQLYDRLTEGLEECSQ